MFNHFNAKWKISGAFLCGRLCGFLSLLFAGTRYNYASLYIAYRQTWTQVEAAIFNLNVATEYKKKRKKKRSIFIVNWLFLFHAKKCYLAELFDWYSFLIQCNASLPDPYFNAATDFDYELVVYLSFSRVFTKWCIKFAMDFKKKWIWKWSYSLWLAVFHIPTMFSKLMAIAWALSAHIYFFFFFAMWIKKIYNNRTMIQ